MAHRCSGCDSARLKKGPEIPLRPLVGDALTHASLGVQRTRPACIGRRSIPRCPRRWSVVNCNWCLRWLDRDTPHDPAKFCHCVGDEPEWPIIAKTHLAMGLPKKRKWKKGETPQAMHTSPNEIHWGPPGRICRCGRNCPADFASMSRVGSGSHHSHSRPKQRRLASFASTNGPNRVIHFQLCSTRSSFAFLLYCRVSPW